jgi:hypothetical protein
MGALIQTKGTQRLANLFNSQFLVLSTARGWNNSITANGVTTKVNICDAFNSGKLLAISDAFIAQNADPTSAQTWPSDMNDLLYPSATLTVTSITNNSSTLTFNIPGNPPGAIVAPAGSLPGSAVSCIGKGKAKRIPKKTTVTSFAPPAGGVLTVVVSQPCPKLVIGDSVCFAKGKYERLVRRWQWYLQNDLTPDNNDAIRQAINSALDDDSYTSILFQTVEDTQQVVVTPLSTLDGNFELSDNMQMNILLMTQSTTAPDKLDPQ